VLSNKSLTNDRHGLLRGFQETVDGVQPDAKLEQQRTEELDSAAGCIGHQQEPICRCGHVRHRTSGHDRCPTAVVVGQLAGTGSRRMSDGTCRTPDRLQPVAGLRQQHKFATVSRLPDEVSGASALFCVAYDISY